LFESFVIMLREGVEAALVVGIMLVILRRTGRRDLQRAVWWGLGLAVVASIAAAFALTRLPINEEAYEGGLYWVSAAFVGSMMWWMHRKGRGLRKDIESRVQRAMEPGPAGAGREAWALGAFAFLMLFREGAETVMFLSAVNLTTDAMLSFIGAVVGLAFSVLFCAMFVKGSLPVNLGRFFFITELVMGIFLAQLAINGYHEFSEAGILPASKGSMAVVGPLVRNNTIFILAITAIPLFIWLTRGARPAPAAAGLSEAERRLNVARSRRDRFYRLGAVTTTLTVLLAVGVVYAREKMPREVPPPEPIAAEGGLISVALEKVADGKLHRYGIECEGRTVRFLVLKTSDGRVRAALDACEICGDAGYLQEGVGLVCLNCAAEINQLSVGISGGCNPIPLAAEVTDTQLRIPLAAVAAKAGMFKREQALEQDCPVCGMKVQISEVSAFEIHGGKTYYLCPMDHCRNLFHDNPTAYLK
jgi:high-affinity iron transporter